MAAKYHSGCADLPAQAIKISGGINPKIDSDAKKTDKTPIGGKLSVTYNKMSLISITKKCTHIKAITKTSIGIEAFNKLLPTKL